MFSGRSRSLPFAFINTRTTHSDVISAFCLQCATQHNLDVSQLQATSAVSYWRYHYILPRVKKMLTGHSKAVIVVNSVFPFFAAVTVALRIYARRLKATSLKSSEYVILVALVARFCLSNWSLLTQYRQSRLHILWAIFTVHFEAFFDSSWKLTRTQGATNGGMGQHVQDLSNAELVVFGKVQIQCGITLNTTMHSANTLRSHFGINFLTYSPFRS